jgi:Zn-dependent alcohol dehydrogenase
MLGTKKKAAILVAPDELLVIDDVQMPAKLEYGQVLVNIMKSGLCGAQLQEISGLKGNIKYMPHLLGHEGYGWIEEVGPGVKKVKSGDMVCLHWRKGGGIEAVNPKYKWMNKEISGGQVTTLASMAVISENRLTRLDDTRDNENLVTLMGCCLSTAIGVVNNDANIKIGENVMILGCGGIGLACMQACRLVGAGRVIGTDIANKAELCNNNGGEFLRDQAIPAIDCIIDTTGNMNLVSRYLAFLSDIGRVILVALPCPDTVLELNNFFGSSGKTVKTTQAGGFNPDIHLNRYLKATYNKGIEKTLITHEFELEQINEAIATLRSGMAGRIMIKC